MESKILQKKRKTSLQLLSPLGKIMMLNIWSIGSKHFKLKNSHNIEITFYLQNDKNIQREIKRFRKELNMPKTLNPSEDVISTPIIREYESINIERYKWVESQPINIQNKFDHFIYSLIENHNLPLHFHDWLKEYILYKKASFIPVDNFMLIDQVIKNANQIERFTLTTGEKKFILKYYKLLIRPKISKDEFREAYKDLKALLSKSRNTLRSFRSFETAKKTSIIGKKIRRIESGASDRNRKNKITSKDLATILNDTDENIDRKAATLRKQKQEIIKRHHLLLNRK